MGKVLKKGIYPSRCSKIYFKKRQYIFDQMADFSDSEKSPDDATDFSNSKKSPDDAADFSNSEKSHDDLADFYR